MPSAESSMVPLWGGKQDVTTSLKQCSRKTYLGEELETACEVETSFSRSLYYSSSEDQKEGNILADLSKTAQDFSLNLERRLESYTSTKLQELHSHLNQIRSEKCLAHDADERRETAEALKNSLEEVLEANKILARKEKDCEEYYDDDLKHHIQAIEYLNTRINEEKIKLANLQKEHYAIEERGREEEAEYIAMQKIVIDQLGMRVKATPEGTAVIFTKINPLDLDQEFSFRVRLLRSDKIEEQPVLKASKSGPSFDSGKAKFEAVECTPKLMDFPAIVKKANTADMPFGFLACAMREKFVSLVTWRRMSSANNN